MADEESDHGVVEEDGSWDVGENAEEDVSLQEIDEDCFHTAFANDIERWDHHLDSQVDFDTEPFSRAGHAPDLPRRLACQPPRCASHTLDLYVKAGLWTSAREKILYKV